MTDKDIIIIYSKGIYEEKEAQKFVKCMLEHTDNTTKIIPLPSEYIDRVERL